MTETLNRALTIGGSDVAGILGISPFRTPLDVWREKVLGERDTVDTPATRAGQRFEKAILNAYLLKILPPGSQLWTPEPFVSGYLRASPDAVATCHGWQRLVEVKTTAVSHEWGETASDIVPAHYAVQAQWYMDLLDLDVCDFPVLVWPFEKRDLLGLTVEEIVAAVDLRLLTVRYSPTLAAEIRERVDRFWKEHVRTETPPPPVDLADQQRLVRVCAGKVVAVTQELVDLLTARDKLKTDMKALEEHEKRNAFAIRNILGDAESAVAPNGEAVVTLKTVERGSYVVEPTKFRQLRTTKLWKKLTKP